MCAPAIPLIGMGVAAATTAVGVVGQIQAANAQAKAINAQLAARDKEIDQKASAEINDRRREARRQQGRILVAAGESGLSLASGNIEGLLVDNAMSATLSNERTLSNRDSEREAAKAEAQAAMPSKPTVLGAGLQIGLSGLGAFTNAGGFKKG